MTTKGYLYFAVAGPFVKIGWAKNPRKRVETLQTGCPYTIRIAIAPPAWRHLEYFHHLRFSSLGTRETGEWFHLRGELVEYLKYLLAGGTLLGMEKDGQQEWWSPEWIGPRESEARRWWPIESNRNETEVSF